MSNSLEGNLKSRRRDFSVCDLIERNSGERWESSMGDTVPCETWLDRSEATRCSTGLGSDVGPGEKLCKDVDGFVFDKEPMRGDKVEEVLEKSRRRIGVILQYKPS